jgi:hypothetical protein
MEKRYQECNSLVKLWRRRHYLKVPFRWLQWKFFSKDKELNGKTTWRLLIGMAQSDMKWYYTEEEFEEMFKKYRDE